MDAILRSSRTGRQAIVADISPTMRNVTKITDDDAILKALSTGESADPILSSRASRLVDANADERAKSGSCNGR